MIESMTNFQLVEYLQVAIRMGANPNYIDKIQEEIYVRMEG